MCNCQTYKGLGSIRIHADSIPDETHDWSCIDFVSWHKLLLLKYGKATADQTFINGWENVRFSRKVSLTTNCPYGNCGFNSYFRKQELGIIPFPALLLCQASDLTEDVIDVAGGAVDSAGGILKSTKYIVPVAIIGVLGLVGYIAYRNSDQIVGVVKNVSSIKKAKA